ELAAGGGDARAPGRWRARGGRPARAGVRDRARGVPFRGAGDERLRARGWKRLPDLLDDRPRARVHAELLRLPRPRPARPRRGGPAPDVAAPARRVPGDGRGRPVTGAAGDRPAADASRPGRLPAQAPEAPTLLAIPGLSDKDLTVKVCPSSPGQHGPARLLRPAGGRGSGTSSAGSPGTCGRRWRPTRMPARGITARCTGAGRGNVRTFSARCPRAGTGG